MRDALSYRTRATPEAVGMVSASSGTEWEYARLDSVVDRTAGRLAALGVDPGDHLGVCMAPRPRYVVLVHAAARRGAVLVPLGHRNTEGELATRADRADVTALVCDAETAPAVTGAAGAVPGPDLPVVSVEADADGLRALGDVEPEGVSPHDWAHPDTLALLSTSGTTGTPKVVTLTVGNVLASVVASAFRLGVDPGDRWLAMLPMHHAGGLLPVYRSAVYGTTLVVREGFDAGPAVDDVGSFSVTGVSVVPTMLRRMMDARGTLPDSLRVVLLGGAPAPAELVERCRDYAVPVYPTYGMTEAASQIATARPREAYDDPRTVGRPLLATDVTVVDGDGRPVEEGETGELVVRGPTVTPGYYDDPASTGEAFGVYGLATGDVGRVDDGRVYVLNRLDDRIVTGGENVDPGEVTAAVRATAGVADVAVVGLPDEEWGEVVSALVVPEPGADLSPEDVEATCRDRLAGFKRPRVVAFTEALPRTDSGTVDRGAVRDRLAADRPERVDIPDAEPVDATGATAADDGSGETPPAGERDADDSGHGSGATGDDDGGGTTEPPEGDDSGEGGTGGTDGGDAAEETGGAAPAGSAEIPDAEDER